MWQRRHQARLTSRPRKRAVGAGAKRRLVFVDRLLATLVHLRHGVTHDVLACWFGVDRSTITRAVGGVRPLLAERGCTVNPDVRLRTLADVVEHLGASGTAGIIDGTEIRVRRPAAGRKDRDKFISGKNKQNAVKLDLFEDFRCGIAAEWRSAIDARVREGGRSCLDRAVTGRCGTRTGAAESERAGGPAAPEHADPVAGGGPSYPRNPRRWVPSTPRVLTGSGMRSACRSARDVAPGLGGHVPQHQPVARGQFGESARRVPWGLGA